MYSTEMAVLMTTECPSLILTGCLFYSAIELQYNPLFMSHCRYSDCPKARKMSLLLAEITDMKSIVVWKHRGLRYYVFLMIMICRQSWSSQRQTYGLTPDPVTPSGGRLTGIPQLDDEVNEILSFVFRDQILPWQTQLTHTNVFTLRVQDGIRAGIAEFSERVRQVDWIPFLTTRLVNTVVSHLRLFKVALTNKLIVFSEAYKAQISYFSKLGCGRNAQIQARCPNSSPRSSIARWRTGAYVETWSQRLTRTKCPTFRTSPSCYSSCYCRR